MVLFDAGWSDDEGYTEPNLGPCCACEKTDATVRNLYMLKLLSPTPGKGWACLECNLPADGAMAVLCDDCHEQKAKFRFACAGWPGKDGRVPFESLTGVHQHSEVIHLLLDERYQEFIREQDARRKN